MKCARGMTSNRIRDSHVCEILQLVEAEDHGKVSGCSKSEVNRPRRVASLVKAQISTSKLYLLYQSVEKIVSKGRMIGIEATMTEICD